MKTKLLMLGALALLLGCGQESQKPTASATSTSQTANVEKAQASAQNTEPEAAQPESTPVVAIDVENGGLRSVDLTNEDKVVLSAPRYIETMPGESTRIERAFENAPPLIPHSTEGLVPITADNNMCTTCHDKSLAKDMGATAIPPTHYVDFRTHKSTGDMVSSERFNCTQCHVPQSDAKIVIGNSFRPTFSNDTLKSSSNLIDVLNEGVE